MFAFVLALAACGDKDDTGTDFVPMEGSWSYSDLAYDSDECGLEASFSPATLEALVWTMTLTDGGFELVLADGDPVSCVLDGMDFTWLDEAGSRQAGQGGPPGKA